MTVRLAWRLYLRHWRRLLFFSSCIAVGVAFLFGIGNFLSAVEAGIASRARELMAADVELGSSRPFDAKARRALERLEAEGHREAELVTFASMLSPEDNAPFLVSVKAAGPGYPFYGRLETSPPGVRPGPGECLLDESAALQHGLRAGARVKLGASRLRIAGLLLREPDRTLAGFNLAPRLLIPSEEVASTGLLRFGSRIRHTRLVALPAGADGPKEAPRLKARLEKELDDPYVSLAAYTDADPGVQETLQRVTTFFVLLSLVALLLGAVGMAASVTMFLNEQLETAGILRCLGLKAREVGAVYGLLCLGIGVQGGLLGCAAGWALSTAGLETARRLLGLAVAVEPGFDLWSLAEGLAVACALAVGLNAAKVRAMARVPPLDVLRERATRLPPSPWATAALCAIGLAALYLFAFFKSNSWLAAGRFTLALAASAAAVSILIGLALGALRLASPAFDRAFALRHGILQLTRQKARTLVFLFTLSIGLTLLGALGLVHRSLQAELLLGRSDRVPDLFLVDVQKSQLHAVAELVGRYGQGASHFAPLVRARLTHINGVPISKRDPATLTLEERSRQRFLTREYNLTYKDALQDSERVTAGAFWQAGETRPHISLEESFAERLGLGLGDAATFDVQGRPVQGTVTSIRSIDWISMQPNFFVVFPKAALENAPQTFIGSLRVRDAPKSARFQRELVSAYPNVSVVDLTKVLDNVQRVLGTLLTALNVLAWFCVGVGLLVLAGTLGLGRRERAENAALYRALGCGRRELVRIDAVEFAAIGALAFAIAALTSQLLGWALAREMSLPFSPDFGTLAWMLAAALLLPLAVGLAVHWPAYRQGVLETLRREA